MPHTCKNCGTIFDGNYCNNCGQPADTHPIDAHFIMHDLRHGLLHINGGMFYSARELFNRPGHSIRDYIRGKRIRHYSPISMVIVMATFYGLLYHALGINAFKGKTDADYDYGMINEWIAHHFSIITLCVIPFISLSSYLIFKKQGYTFIEHIILNSFYSTQKLWIRILTLPLLYLFKHDVHTHIIPWLLIPDALLMFWCYSQFFTGVGKFKVVLKTLVAYLLGLLLVTIASTIVFVVLYT